MKSLNCVDDVPLWSDRDDYNELLSLYPSERIEEGHEGVSVWKWANSMSDPVAENRWLDRQRCAGSEPFLLSGGRLALFQCPCRE